MPLHCGNGVSTHQGSIPTAVGTWWQKCASTMRSGAYCQTLTVRSSEEAVARKLRLAETDMEEIAPECIAGSASSQMLLWLYCLLTLPAVCGVGRGQAGQGGCELQACVCSVSERKGPPTFNCKHLRCSTKRAQTAGSA